MVQVHIPTALAGFRGQPDERSARTAARRRVVRLVAGALITSIVLTNWAGAQVGVGVNHAGQKQDTKKTARPPLPIAVSPDWTRLAMDHEVWLDLKHNRVLVGGFVCLRRGALEMFACPRLTKEHESVVAVYTPARFVHAGLLALGMKPGKPVKYRPKYVPATGTLVDVTVVWKDKQGKLHQTPAEQWVKNRKTNKALAYPWVFVGSGFWTDQRSGQRYYSADAGDFICVSNFPTAMLDLPIESSQANDDLMFTAFTEHIPPLKTRVMLILKQHAKKITTKKAKKENASPKPTKPDA